MKNRGCVAEAFWERFGVAQGRQKGDRPNVATGHLATIFGQKSKKWHPKRHLNIDVEKVSKMYAKRVPKWDQNGHRKHWFFILFRKRRKRSRPFVFPYKSWFRAYRKRWNFKKNRCKIDARRSVAKIVKKCKIEWTWDQQSVKNPEKYQKSQSKSTSENRCEKRVRLRNALCGSAGGAGRSF